ncbi:hypothetical protein S83_020262 [Arachis hypogaea]
MTATKSDKDEGGIRTEVEIKLNRERRDSDKLEEEEGKAAVTTAKRGKGECEGRIEEEDGRRGDTTTPINLDEEGGDAQLWVWTKEEET